MASDDPKTAADHTIDIGRLTRTVAVRFIFVLVLLGVLLFGAAGTLLYWQAWIWIGVLCVPAMMVIAHFMKTEPRVIERRMRLKETQAAQRTIITVGWVVFILSIALPGLDRRYGWSSVPAALVLIADGIVFCGYLLFARVLHENRFASRTIEVEEGQTVITTGPYAIVRHPLYVGALMIYILTPLALGSYWGLAVAPFLIGTIVARIRNEEILLLEHLDGYREYVRKTRYRLIPGVW